VGSYPAGNADFGHSDLSGNVAEIVADAEQVCVAGGSFDVRDAAASTGLRADACAAYVGPAANVGFRCAQNP
jgi:formylglycine-generating enzyme required for sulfatase activity